MCLVKCFKHYLYIIFFILYFIDISKSSVSIRMDCTSCQCLLGDGETLDLSPLAKTSQPLIAATNRSLYIYHPCTDIPLNAKQDNECQKDFGLCYFVPKNPTDKPVNFQQVLSNTTFGTFKLLAVNKEAVFQITQTGHITIEFEHDNKNPISTFIKLECNENLESYKLTINKTTSDEHVLTLTSRHACVKYTHHMSGGAVFFLILVIILATYFIGGILVLKFIRGANGIEMIPNHEFWCSLPQLTKDGVAYCISCGKSAPDSYEKI